MDQLLFALWFFLPAGVANATPVLASRLPGLKQWRAPLDLGITWRSKRLFGPNKTWRGVLAGTVIGSLTAMLVYPTFIHYFETTGLLLVFSAIAGALLGFGALIGDAVESFLKRQLGIDAGRSWFPFDQIDYILGGLLAVSLLVRLSPLQVIFILVVWFGMHLLFSYIGYLLKLKPKPI